MRILFLFFLLFAPTILSAQDSWILTKNGCKIHNPNPVRSESVEWTGNCVDSIGEGIGRLTWYRIGLKTKQVYDGMMVNGRPEGYGIYQLSSVATLEGEFKNGDLYDGTRTEHIGKSIYVYKGRFINDQLYGIGELKVKNSYTYKGEFKDGKAEGYGIESIGGHYSFEGNFKNGYYKDGKLVSEKYGYIIESDNWKYYSAQTGTLTYADGTIYKGELKHNLPHGKGIKIFTNGDTFAGSFKNDVPHGKGELTLANGIIYSVTWRDGVIEGRGQIIYPDGNRGTGIWKNNILIKEKNSMTYNH